jgi:SPP1 gp7 family putative phage head morphogenesis protein
VGLQDRLVRWLTKAAGPPAEVKTAWASPPVSFIPRDNDGHTIDVEMGNRAAYTASVLINAAMRYRATKLSEAPLVVMDETDDGMEWLPDHELAELLQYPNADEEMADLVEATSLAMDSTGMAIWLIDRDRGTRPARLSLYGADEFTVSKAEGRIYGRFDVTVEGGHKIVGPDDVVFFRNPNPTDRWHGLAPVDVLARHIGIEAKLLRSILHGLDNAVVPGLTITYPETFSLTDEQRVEFKSTLQANYAEARNHGKPLVLGGGGTATQNTLGFAGLEGGALYRDIEAAVCVTFGVRPEILAMSIGLENAPWSNMRIAQRLSYDETIIPLWGKYQRTLTRQLLRQVDEDPAHLVRFSTEDVRALQADAEQDARISSLLKDIATRNQRRQIAGLEPMTDDPEFWDDVQAPEPPKVPGVPGEEVPQPPMPPAKGQLKAMRERRKFTARWLRYRLWESEMSSQRVVWTMAAAKRLEEDRAYVLDMADVMLRPAKSAKEIVRPPADPETIRRMQRTLMASKQIEEKWAPIAKQLTKATAELSVANTAQVMGMSFDLLQPGVTDFVAVHSAELVTNVTTTTKEAIRDALQQGLEAGEGIPEIRARIMASGAFGEARAELIARTETTAAANGAANKSLADYSERTGRAVEKSWLSARDDRVREEHAAMDDGSWIPLDDTFANGEDEPSAPGCRCTLLYRFSDEEGT